MDKAEKVRRGASRFSLLKRQNIISGSCGSLLREFSFPGKSKKERIRRLSVVGRRLSSSYEDCEMGCESEISDRDDQNLGSCNKFKLPKQLLDNRNGVDHTSVPRKLRSAMKKRNRESLSPTLPDTKKVNHRNNGIELQKKDGVKKSKLKMKRGGLGWCNGEAVCGEITKDEEEVVETLYALAGMFPNNDSNHNTELDSESLQAKQSPKLEFQESPVTENNFSSIQHSRNPDIKISAKKTEKVLSLKEPNAQEQPNLLESKDFLGGSDNSLPQLNLRMTGLQGNDENRDEKTPGTSGLSLDTITIKLPMQPDTSAFKSRSELPLRPVSISEVVDNDIHLKEKHQNNEPTKNDQALWPSLSSSMLLGAGTRDPLQYPNLPSWLDMALCTQRHGLTENNYNAKVSKCMIDRRSWKRCANHVYISRLIQNLKAEERKDKLALQLNRLTQHEMFNGVRNGLKEVASTCSIDTCDVNIPNQSKNGNAQLRHVPRQTVPVSESHDAQKPSFDFLSSNTKRSSKQPAVTLEAGNQIQVPYQQNSLTQQQELPFALPQARYWSARYPDQLSVAATQQVQLKLPPYFSNKSSGEPRPNPMTLTKVVQQQTSQQQQHQQWFWAAQMAANCRPTVGTATNTVQLPSWQNGRHDSPSLPCIQPLNVPTRPFLEIPGPKHPSFSPQQQQFMVMTSLSTPRLKGQDHLPSIYVENGGRFDANGQLPLQLLCNERY